ncbi:Asp-tRNA(Asn)/Glu-tRNA(Gln) amidotransferase subunit GatC [Neisseriaceae bacterium CLB008]|nr:Asp-tRNA(Asn)/Glu-tRNA(Gln) amidotransferase subunit GatC [Neisseriaceae bacterium]MBP6345092.1 Asp-tRNA(Asn)/Glu-tRNA(Gln) amidotransferase subunit GatC [Neisseriaceae bacterium]MBP6861700.1 Asp-tRNA(Asn)/Glu-tRNA(Gln) amidotransferase subunit GatC [Neisseriaceae bacterium]
MAFNQSDVEKIAQLSRLSLTEAESRAMQLELDSIFQMIEKMQAVNTDGVEPMSHPHEIPLRLRDDVVTEVDNHKAYQEIAPQVQNSLYLVPKVIE